MRAKIVEYLLIQLRDQGRRTLQLRHSREMLAEMFGVTRPTLSRVFSELCKEGVISTDGETVHVLDPARLEEMAEKEE